VLFTPDYCGKCEQCVLGKTPYCDQVVPVTFIGTRADGTPRAYQDGKPVRAAFFGQSRRPRSTPPARSSPARPPPS
jgi:aryl-alcohol dehydrogenase